MARPGTLVSRELTAARADELVAAGHRRRHVFPHRTVFLPRPGPDGYLLAKRMVGATDPAALRELVLYATGSALDGLPPELFFDDDIVWHQRQLGLPGQLATADVVVSDKELWSMAHVADVVQRIGRRRELKTRVEKRFAGWQDMLLNSLLALAAELGLSQVHVPTAAFQMRHTDPRRTVQPELFERVYDRAVNRLYRTERSGNWWTVDIAANRDRIVSPERRDETLTRGRTICVCHDIEADLGHAPGEIELPSLEFVERMLSIEAAAAARATYSVVGRLLEDVRGPIEAAGHCLAFHSYDHNASRLDLLWLRRAGIVPDQLSRCRRLDYRLKGYRAPRSRITSELRTENLLHHNFEWLSSDTHSLGHREPALGQGLVRLPVHLDDWDLFRGKVGYDDWEARALAIAAEHDVAVISLHDCYGRLWLDGYPGVLARLGELGELRTLDEVAADVTLAASL